MTLEKVTNKNWNNMYKEGMFNQAEDIKAATIEFQSMIDNYNVMVSVYQKYISDSKTHRIIHKVDMAKGILSYSLNGKRQVGFDYKGKQK